MAISVRTLEEVLILEVLLHDGVEEEMNEAEAVAKL